MIIPITINMSPLIQAFSLSKKQTEDIVDNIVKGVTGRVAQKIEILASQNLGTTKQVFINAIRVVDTGRLTGRILIDYTNKLVQKLEEGSPPYSLRESLLNSSKAKTSKDGTRYITVPIKWGTPGSLGSAGAVQNIMPNDIYQEAKKLESKSYLSFDKLPQDFQALQSREQVIVGDKLFEKYQHKNPIYEGITKVTDSVTGQNTYTSFRRVSEKNTNPNAWIHPGFQKRDFMGQALSQVNISELAGNLLDEQLDSLGI